MPAVTKQTLTVRDLYDARTTSACPVRNANSRPEPAPCSSGARLSRPTTWTTSYGVSPALPRSSFMSRSPTPAKPQSWMAVNASRPSSPTWTATTRWERPLQTVGLVRPTSSYRQQPPISQTHSCAHPAEPASSTPLPTGKPPSPPIRKSVDTLAKR